MENWETMSISARGALRLSATLLFGGVVISFVAGLFHPAHAAANDHPAAFAEYAASTIWAAVHLAQFIGMVGIIAGLLVLDAVLDQRPWTGRLGAFFALVALALYGVFQAVDGVALKQAVEAWVEASEAEKAARFANAETIRWLEWGAKSYYLYSASSPPERIAPLSCQSSSSFKRFSSICLSNWRALAQSSPFALTDHVAVIPHGRNVSGPISSNRY